jgi:hypothetical protein
MTKTDAEVVKEVLDRMGRHTNDAKAREITKVLGKRVRQRARDRKAGRQANGAATARLDRRSAEPRYSPIRIQGEPLSSTILRDRGSY